MRILRRAKDPVDDGQFGSVVNTTRRDAIHPAKTTVVQRHVQESSASIVGEPIGMQTTLDFLVGRNQEAMQVLPFIRSQCSQLQRSIGQKDRLGLQI